MLRNFYSEIMDMFICNLPLLPILWWEFVFFCSISFYHLLVCLKKQTPLLHLGGVMEKARTVSERMEGNVPRYWAHSLITPAGPQPFFPGGESSSRPQVLDSPCWPQQWTAMYLHRTLCSPCSCVSFHLSNKRLRKWCIMLVRTKWH